MTEREAARLLTLTKHEGAFWRSGRIVGGMDEVGRGPLAGPVVAACVVLPREPLVEGVDDSKKLSEKKREKLYDRIAALGTFGIGVVDWAVIDEINILQATRLAFKAAYENMTHKVEALIVDAVKGLDIPAEQLPLIRGDAVSYLVAAASIVAKVTRDRMMAEFDGKYPEYGFARNKGYGTVEHIAAIRRYGPCPIHRRSFIKKWL
ncbi:MAG: ribonuclease HII [Christensenellales bacterium]|jgi:ribonuclease HII